MKTASSLACFRPMALLMFGLSGATAWADPAPPPLEHQHTHPQGVMAPTLTQSGNDVFGAIQEVLRQLEADPATDWKKVNLEALRLHLLDMRNFTEYVEVVSQRPIDKGIEIVLRPMLPNVVPSLERAFAAHPKQLKTEIGWDMKVSQDQDRYVLRITAADARQADKIRGLGYIGVMAYGNHHPVHHWALATGQMPH